MTTGASVARVRRSALPGVPIVTGAGRGPLPGGVLLGGDGV